MLEMLHFPKREWVHEAACRKESLDLFFGDSPAQPSKQPSAIQQQHWNEAKAVCRTCPVLNQCRRDTLGEEFGVFGGYDQYERYQIRKKLPAVASRWPAARRRALGSRAWALRKRGLTWQKIQVDTGLIQELAEELANEYAEYLKQARQAREACRAQAAAEAPRWSRPLPFPEENGTRDLWARHNGRVADAYYRGETSDGAWIHIHVSSGRAHSLKWVKAEDIRFHKAVPRFVIDYPGRPDRVESDLVA